MEKKEVVNIRSKRHGCFHKSFRQWIIILFLVAITILLFLNLVPKFYIPNQIQNYEKRSQQRPLNFPPDYLLDDLVTEAIPKNKYCEVIHIGVVCSGFNSNVFFHTLLKSLYFYRANPIHFHIVVNKVSWRVLKVLFDTWQAPEVSVTFYDADEYIKDVRWIPNTHYSGNHGLLKLLFPKIIPVNVTRKIIILDTDLTIVGDIYNLWTMFRKFNKRQVLGLVENQSEYYLGKLTESEPWPAIGKGFNSGVILYDLLKLRNLKWDKLWSNVTKRTASTHGATGLADQDIINAVIKENPHIVYEVPCFWNTQMGDNSQSSDCYKFHKVKIVHWNSPRKYNVQHQNAKYFKSLTTSFLEYNGNLLRNSPLFCNKPPQLALIPPESFTDDCSKFRKQNSFQYRTLLFFREFKYEINDNDITLLTQLSFDRIHNIENIVKLWQGPVTFTFYITDAELVKVLQFISDSDILQGRLNVAYHAVFKDGELYPINYLRNTALRNVRTPYVFLTDVDFQPMLNMYEVLKGYLNQINMEKKALIVPAFEVKKTHVLKSQMSVGKSGVVKALEDGNIAPFLSESWPSGHEPTNYGHWKIASQPYRVTWKPDFEPYIVVKSNVVEYNEEFTGFGWNKVSHIMELEAQDYEFRVLPDVFIIHKPHPLSSDNLKYRNSAKYRICLRFLKKNFIKRLNSIYNKTFDIPLDTQNSDMVHIRPKREVNISNTDEVTTTLYDSTDFFMVWGGTEKLFGKKVKKTPIRNTIGPKVFLQMEKEEILSDLRNHNLDSHSNEEDTRNNETVLKSVMDKVAILEDRNAPVENIENFTIVNVNINQDVLKNIADNIEFAVNIELPGAEPSLNDSSQESHDDFDDYEAYDYDAIEKQYRDKFTAKHENNKKDDYVYSDEEKEYTSEEKKIHKPAKPLKFAPEVELLVQQQKNLRKSGKTDKSDLENVGVEETDKATHKIPLKHTTEQQFEDIYEEFRVKFKDFDKIPRQN